MPKFWQKAALYKMRKKVSAHAVLACEVKCDWLKNVSCLCGVSVLYYT